MKYDDFVVAMYSFAWLVSTANKLLLIDSVCYDLKKTEKLVFLVVLFIIIGELGITLFAILFLRCTLLRRIFFCKQDLLSFTLRTMISLLHMLAQCQILLRAKTKGTSRPNR